LKPIYGLTDVEHKTLPALLNIHGWFQASLLNIHGWFQASLLNIHGWFQASLLNTHEVLK